MITYMACDVSSDDTTLFEERETAFSPESTAGSSKQEESLCDDWTLDGVLVFDLAARIGTHKEASPTTEGKPHCVHIW